MIYDTPDKTRDIVGLDGYNYFLPSSYIPTIKPSDYEYGYITRYFVGNINYSNINETNARDYNMTDSSFFKKTKITWKVSGTEFNVYKGKMLESTGVVTSVFMSKDNKEYCRINVDGKSFLKQSKSVKHAS